MPQYDFQIADYERIFRKRYKLVVLTVFLAAGFSIMFARMKKPSFQAIATVKVDRNSVMGLGMEAMYGSWDNIETQAMVITSFPVLLKAAKILGMVSDSLGDDALPTDEATLGVLAGLRGSILAQPAGTTNIINIFAVSGEPKRARDVANAMAIAYKEFSIRGKKLHASQTKEFVQSQLAQCQGELSGIENAMRIFSEQQKLPTINASTDRTITDAAQIEQKLLAVEEAIQTVTEQRERLASKQTDSIASPKPSPRIEWVTQVTEADPGLTRLNDRLIQLQLERTDQLAYYKPENPAILKTNENIAQTSERIASELTRKLAKLEAERAHILEDKAGVEKEISLLPANQMHYARLIRNLRINESLHELLTTKEKESEIAEAGVVDDVTIMSMATMPGAPSNKNMAQAGGVGIFLGLIFGIIFAIVREMFDTSIGTIEDVERMLKLTVLAVIPHIHIGDANRNKDRKRKKGDPPPPVNLRSFLVTHFMPKEPTAETYRILRTNLEYLAYRKPLRTMLLTSATMQEGKSTTIANLAVAYAQQGKKVVLLECNLRRPSLQKVFGLERGPGTADILIEKAKWQDCVRTVTDLALGDFSMDEILAMPGLDNFHIIPYGHRPPNPTELLSGKRMDTLLAELGEYFDVVLVDAPPILPVADSIVLSTKVDGVVLIYKVGKAPRNSLRLAKERLETVHANILGLVLNDIRPETTGLTYSSYYMYAYVKEKDRAPKPTGGFPFGLFKRKA